VPVIVLAGLPPGVQLAAAMILSTEHRP
jgi:hypothetical protein